MMKSWMGVFAVIFKVKLRFKGLILTDSAVCEPQETTCSFVAGIPKNFQTNGSPDNLVLIVRRIFSSGDPSSIDLNATV